jgi:hypothetical protein
MVVAGRRAVAAGTSTPWRFRAFWRDDNFSSEADRVIRRVRFLRSGADRQYKERCDQKTPHPPMLLTPVISVAGEHTGVRQIAENLAAQREYIGFTFHAVDLAAVRCQHERERHA